MITINGVEFEFDGLDAKDMELFEEKSAVMLKEINSAKDRAKGKQSSMIRLSCEAVFKFFDETLGDGASNKIFGDSTHLGKCLEAFGEMTTQMSSGIEGDITSLVDHYTPTKTIGLVK